MWYIQTRGQNLNREDGWPIQPNKSRTAPPLAARAKTESIFVKRIGLRPSDQIPSSRTVTKPSWRKFNFGYEIKVGDVRQIRSRRNPAATSWRKIYFRQESHSIRADTATSDGWVASRLPWAGLLIFIKNISVGRCFSRSAAHHNELHPSWIFVQNNSVKANPLRLVPDRRCEIFVKK